MELKKSPKADLENKKSYFMQIGLIVALAFVIGLFTWSQTERKVEITQQEEVVVETEMVEVTIQEDKRPPAPEKTQAVAISEMLNIVKNDAKIEETINILDLDVTQDLAVDVSKFGGTYTGEAVRDEEEPVIFAEEPATFQGGDINKFRAWVGKNLKYPSIAADNGVQGTVSLQFIIERDGSVSGIKVLRGVEKTLDAEAVRVISSSPKWSPAKNGRKPVRIYVNMPVIFQLE